MGQEVQLDDRWAVTVTTVTHIGQDDDGNDLIRIELMLVNQGQEEQRFPFGELYLTDAAERAYDFNAGTLSRLGERNQAIVLNVSPSIPKDVVAVFTVLPDAGTEFVVWHRDNPDFAVSVMLEAPKAEATPLPPTAAGQAVTFDERWTVTVLTASQIGLDKAGNTLVRLDMTLVNNGQDSTIFPSLELYLTDAGDRVYDFGVAETLAVSQEIALNTEPSIPKDVVAVFTVLPDAGTEFVVRHRDNPDFAVAVSLGVQG